MTYCRICGTEADTVRFRVAKRQSLCDDCASDTPRKACREYFEAKYWGKYLPEVPNSTRREFWQDYLSSTLTLDAYIEATTEPC